jgi:hypothetical protein
MYGEHNLDLDIHLIKNKKGLIKINPFFIIFVNMKALINLLKPINSIKGNIDLVLDSNIESITFFTDYDELNLSNYIFWTMYLEEQGWCVGNKLPEGIEDPTLSDMAKEPMDKIVIDFNSSGINKYNSIYIRDIKLMLLNDQNN